MHCAHLSLSNCYLERFLSLIYVQFSDVTRTFRGFILSLIYIFKFSFATAHFQTRPNTCDFVFVVSL